MSFTSMNCEFLRMKHSLEFEIRFKHSSIHLALLCIVEAGQACADAIIHLYSGSSFSIYKDKKKRIKEDSAKWIFSIEDQIWIHHHLVGPKPVRHHSYVIICCI